MPKGLGHWASDHFHDPVNVRGAVHEILCHPICRQADLQGTRRDEEDRQQLEAAACHHLPSSEDEKVNEKSMKRIEKAW